MTLSSLAYIAVDLAALVLLVGALYAPRHSRKDLTAAYIGVNVGVLAVTLLLSTASVAAGLGLGLFGVLSIIRLRSTELAQHEVAYFFAALALGLLGGIQTAPLTMVAALMALVVAALWIADHPALMRRNRHQVIMLDRAFTDEAALTAHLERTLGASMRSVEVQRLDLVNDTTLVDVRFQLQRRPQPHAQPTSASSTTPASSTQPAQRPQYTAAPTPYADSAANTASTTSPTSPSQQAASTPQPAAAGTIPAATAPVASTSVPATSPAVTSGRVAAQHPATSDAHPKPDGVGTLRAPHDVGGLVSAAASSLPHSAPSARSRAAAGHAVIQG